MEIKTSIETQGPLFKHSANNVLRSAYQTGIQELVERGEDFLNKKASFRPQGEYLSPSMGGKSTGHYRRSISTQVKNLEGVIHDGGVVYGPWLEGKSSRNQTTRFKGYAMFRQTEQFLEKKFKEVMEKHTAKAVRRLGK